MHLSHIKTSATLSRQTYVGRVKSFKIDKLLSSIFLSNHLPVIILLKSLSFIFPFQSNSICEGKRSWKESNWLDTKGGWIYFCGLIGAPYAYGGLFFLTQNCAERGNDHCIPPPTPGAYDIGMGENGRGHHEISHEPWAKTNSQL